MALSEDTRQEMWVQSVMDRRKLLDEVSVGQDLIRDRTVIYLTSGTVGLSLLLLNAIGSKWGEIEHMTVLIWSWGASFTSLVFAVLTFSIGKTVFRNELDDHELRHIYDEKPPARKTDLLNSLAITLNWMSVTGFVAGGTLLILFAWLNLPQ